MLELGPSRIILPAQRVIAQNILALLPSSRRT